MDIVQEVKRLSTGNIIPKPDAKADFVVKGWGIRRGEEALILSNPKPQKRR